MAFGFRRLLVGALLIACTAASAQTFVGAMSGAWWSPERGGEGQVIMFETVGGRNVATLAYFTYSASGAASWLVGNADYQAGAASISIPLVTGSGARFGAAYRPSDTRFAAAGTAMLEYVSCSQMRLRYTGSESMTVNLTRLIGPLSGVECPSPRLAPAPAASTFRGSMSGAWWNPSRDGEGQLISFETVGQRNVVFFTYFTYSAGGEATWLAGNLDYRTGATSLSIPLIKIMGPRFGAAFRPSDARVSAAGNVVLDYVSCSQMKMRFAGTEDFAFDLTRLVGPLSDAACSTVVQAQSQLDSQLRPLLAAAGQTGNAIRARVLPSIDDPVANLGKLLFFSKALSGNLDTACASCHHPALGGADGLSFSIGTGAAQTSVLGPGRRLAAGGFSVARNSNTFFNAGLFDKGLFWDSRTESLGQLAEQNGAGSGIRTPGTPRGVADPTAGASLPAAQARFPVVNVTEMRGPAFAGASDAEARSMIASRLGNYGTTGGQLAPSQWLARFRTAFGNEAGSAQELITFDNIALAIAQYERSAVFTDTPWSRYVRGDNQAIGDDAKRGALFFFRTTAEGGAQCAQCHKGDFFTDEKHHAVGFPQIGNGMGDGNGSDDFGRGRQTLSEADRYRYRTPTLLNVELSAPYGHAGAYRDLATVIAHYVVPDQTIADFLRTRAWCALAQFFGMTGCAQTALDVSRNTTDSLNKMKAVRQSTPDDSMPVVDPVQVPQSAGADIEAFLMSLTDPCLRDRGCFGRWIPQPSEAPDAHQLNATNSAGQPL